MKFADFDKRATKLFKEHHEVKFYEMILCYSLEALFESDEETDIPEYQYNGLLNCMVNYLADNYHVSPWHVADALTALIRKYGIEKTIADTDYDCELLEKELENI